MILWEGTLSRQSSIYLLRGVLEGGRRSLGSSRTLRLVNYISFLNGADVKLQSEECIVKVGAEHEKRIASRCKAITLLMFAVFTAGISNSTR